MRAAILGTVALVGLAHPAAAPRTHDLLTYAVVTSPAAAETTELRTGLCISSVDGSQRALLDETSGDDASPAWSRDGATLAFEHFDPQSGRTSIAFIKADGTRATFASPPGRHPSWSPDGSRLVYTFNADLVVRDTRTWTRRQVTHGRTDTLPAWSPSGAQIAFVRRRRLWVIRPDGTGPRRLTHETVDRRGGPTWSPDGTKIAYVHGGRLSVIRSAGGQPRRLARDSGLASPAWSPDGSLIAFETAEGLAAVTPDGSTRVATPLGGAYPSWRTGTARPIGAALGRSTC